MFCVNLFNNGTEHVLKRGQFCRNSIFPPRVWLAWLYLLCWSFTAVYYFVLLSSVFLFFLILLWLSLLWLRLSGLSLQFSPTWQRYERLTCMWTGGFTSFLIETVIIRNFMTRFSCTSRCEESAEKINLLTVWGSLEASEMAPFHV